MAFGIGAAILGSAVLGSVTSAFGASKQNKAAEAASQKQMDFQERMSNTQYQRAMDDMRAAGLNPILAYKQGGAGTPGGSTYSPVNVGAAATAGAQAGASSAVSAKRINLEKQKTFAEINNTNEDTRNKQVERDLLNETYRSRSISNEILMEDLKIRESEAASAINAKAFHESPAGRYLKWFEMGSRSVIPFYGQAKPPGKGITINR